MTKVLIVDDQESQRRMLAEILAVEGKMTVYQAGRVDAAISAIREYRPEVVLTDLKMPGKDGLSLLKELTSFPLPPEVIVITAFGTIETAIKAGKLGAYDYLTKPIKPDEVLFLVEKAKEKYSLRQESLALKQELAQHAGAELVAQSASMLAVVDMIDKIAATDSTVLIRGETGTGKECAARMIHLRGKRGGKLMRSVNCAAFADTLLDSELFGYEKGAFTGANARTIGIIESAEGGTLFLDEIGDMTQNTQAKILRVLQERSFRRVGGTENVPVDIRIIAATNKNLEESIRQGAFREDLFYRLNIVPLSIPPLRQRKEDIPLLFNHFMGKYGHAKRIDDTVMHCLIEYHWPGNVRELEALVERISVLSTSDVLTISEIPSEITNSQASAEATFWELPEKGIVFEDLERQLIAKALEKAGGNMVTAAKLLGMSYRAFRYRVHAFGLHEN